MSFIARAPVAFVAVMSICSSAMAGLITNGSFESPALASNTHSAFNSATTPSGFGWTVINNIDVVNANGVFFGIDWADTGEHAIDGNQVLDLNGDIGGGIFQDLATIAGQTYHLSFWFSNNPVSWADLTPESALVSLVDFGTSALLYSDSIVHASATLEDPDWTLYEAAFVAIGSVTRLSFLSTSNPSSPTGGIFLDDVSVSSSSTPEPASLALWAALGVMAPVVASRRKTSAVNRRSS